MNRVARVIALLLYPFAVVAVELRRLLVDREFARLPATAEEPEGPRAPKPKPDEIVSAVVSDAIYTDCTWAVKLTYGDGRTAVAHRIRNEGWSRAGIMLNRHLRSDRDIIDVCEAAVFDVKQRAREAEAKTPKPSTKNAN